MKNEKGFTIIEMLVVLTIIVIIAALVVPRVSFTTTAAKQKVDTANLAAINVQLEKYYLDNGALPADDAAASTLDSYFPNGAPTPLQTGKVFKFDATSSQYALEDSS